jgi:hypothetical protein
MKFRYALLYASVATMSACAAAGPSERQVEAERQHIDAVWLAMDKATQEAGKLSDESAKTIRLTRLSRLNDLLGYSGLLLVMGGAMPDQDGFELAVRTISEVDLELAVMRYAHSEDPNSNLPK